MKQKLITKIKKIVSDIDFLSLAIVSTIIAFEVIILQGLINICYNYGI